ncbi:hypothetical protein QR680_014783 [Steinernema hermaphroditum]|uniref:Uncharacterized protein n=1 Tax=Steinernema hermaphroditum TaxID=289476 RepID=A0AA39M3T2_9BILA|nr:hypothetical protein QR680_014783 [Steinernema hermaphroditum]
MRTCVIALFLFVGFASGHLEEATENGGEKHPRRYGVIRGYRKYKPEESSESSEEDGKDDLSRPGSLQRDSVKAVRLFPGKSGKPTKKVGIAQDEKPFQWIASHNAQNSHYTAPAWDQKDGYNGRPSTITDASQGPERKFTPIPLHVSPTQPSGSVDSVVQKPKVRKTAAFKKDDKTTRPIQSDKVTPQKGTTQNPQVTKESPGLEPTLSPEKAYEASKSRDYIPPNIAEENKALRFTTQKDPFVDSAPFGDRIPLIPPQTTSTYRGQPSLEITKESESKHSIQNPNPTSSTTKPSSTHPQITLTTASQIGFHHFNIHLNPLATTTNHCQTGVKRTFDWFVDPTVTKAIRLASRWFGNDAVHVEKLAMQFYEDIRPYAMDRLCRKEEEDVVGDYTYDYDYQES